jgi:hypothetical protein
MATRLYLHNATNGLANLPTDEQSTKTVNKALQAAATNFAMDTGIGPGQFTGGSGTTANSTTMVYMGRWVSKALSGITSISANTWTVNFAVSENSVSSNFPVSGANQPIWINCYVWRPGTGTLGTILDGNSNSDFSEPTATTVQVVQGTFSGSSVASVQDGDVLCIELWCDLTATPSQNWQDRIIYDGSIENTTPGTVVSNHAAFIETPQALTFAAPGASPTRLFFHAASSPYSNLPTTEQSTLTSTNNVDAQTVNRSMDPVKGVLSTQLSFSTTASTTPTLYYTKFVSPTIDTTATGTTISANTWDYAFTANQGTSTVNFPCTGTSQPVYVNCYVWETANGTKLGTILDGNSNSDFDVAGSGTNNFIKGTFAGSSVSSVTNTCVIIMEIWFQIAPAASDFARFKYDGILITADNGSNSNPASYIGTPQEITFNDITILYFRPAANGVSGTLPSTEQSTITETVHGDAQTVNRTLHTTRGIGQIAITTTSSATASAQNIYFTKFVSWQPLNVTSIPAVNWGYSFAAAEPNLAANYPVTSTNKAVYVNCYVWRTSNGTLTGTILDGNTLASYDEPGAINNEVSENGVFSGAAVTGITPGDDVLVFEVWFQVTQGGATARADQFYFDGATITQETGLAVADSASCLIASTALSFGIPIAQTVYLEWEEC